MLLGIRTMAETAALRFMAAGMDKETAAWDSFGKAVASLDRKLKMSAAAKG